MIIFLQIFLQNKKKFWKMTQKYNFYFLFFLYFEKKNEWTNKNNLDL